MIVTATEVQNNFGKYMDLAAGHEIIITRNGLPAARLIGMEETISFLSDRLVGLVPNNISEDEVKAERMARQ